MKKVKILTITLVIILITAIAFCGIYIQKQNRMENVVKDYEYAMDLKGTRNIKLQPNNEEGTEINVEDYKKSKEILEKRLEKMGVNNYTIKLDEQTGEIIVEISENETTDAIVSQIATVGKFEIQDSETGEVLMNNSDIKLANVMSGADNTTTTQAARIYLNIEFTKDGAKKLEDISNKYIKVEETENNTDENSEVTDEATDETSTESGNEESTEKKITIKLDDTEIMTTSFDEPITTGRLQLSMGGSSSDQKVLQGYASQASSIAIVLDTGNLPVKYQAAENQYILSDITSQELSIVIYVLLAIVVIALIRFIIKYKKQGTIATIAYIGLISVFLILIRYANVILSIDGIFAIAIVLVLNYIFVNKLISKLNKEESKERINKKLVETYKEFFIRIMPVCILAIVFCFINWSPISSFGMVMFWGITLIAIYNSIVTNILLKIEADK